MFSFGKNESFTYEGRKSRNNSFLNTSIEMERLIEKAEEKKDEDRYEINVGNKKFDFNCEDNLFKLTEPIGLNKGV